MEREEHYPENIGNFIWNLVELRNIRSKPVEAYPDGFFFFFFPIFVQVNICCGDSLEAHHKRLFT